MTKKCSKCQKTLDDCDYYKSSNSVSGLSSWCKFCSKKASSTWAKENKVKNRIKASRWRAQNPEREREVKSKFYTEHKESILESSRVFYANHAERERKESRKYYLLNKREVNRKNAEYNRKRRKLDLNFRLRGNMRVLVRAALKGKMRPYSITKALGCNDLATYIRSTYLPGMTDGNYGCGPEQWSVDHIIPLSKFDLTDPEQFSKANHYTNLRAFWHVDNVKKSNK